jgi:hypothetical protein
MKSGTVASGLSPGKSLTASSPLEFTFSSPTSPLAIVSLVLLLLISIFLL